MSKEDHVGSLVKWKTHTLSSDMVVAVWEYGLVLPDIPPHFSREPGNLDF